MASPKKEQRQTARRKADRQSSRRRESISPVKRLAAAPGEVEFWATRDFETFGQVSIVAHKRAAGLTGIACFLIDRGVAGLLAIASLSSVTCAR